MNQMPLFDALQAEPLATQISRDGAELRIPEGLNTIPCTHGIHRFPGKFIPNLPRYLIREYLPSQRRSVCDPFCGSGTSLVEAALAGKSYLGIDVDPLAVLVSQAKVNVLSEEEIHQIECHWTKFDFNSESASHIPAVPNLSHWFTRNAIRQLSAIKRRCLELPIRPRTFCLVVFSSIIRRVSKADDQTQKTYVSHTLPKTPPTPEALFPLFLKRAVIGMRQYASLLPGVNRGSITLGDCSRLPSLRNTDIVTSPPYIDSIDYVYNQMLEYFWLMSELGLTDIEDYRRLRKAPMGFRRDKESGRARDRLSVNCRENFDRVVKAIALRSPKEKNHVFTFFDDFAEHCDAASKAQSKGAHYACVIGESLVRGMTVPTVDIVKELFLSSNYSLQDSFTYEIRRHYMKFPRRDNSGTIKTDHILIFRR